MNRISGILFVAAILLAPQLVAAEPAGPASGKTALQKQPPKTIERVPGGEAGHEKNWLEAIKANKPAISNFDYAGPFAELVLLGNLAVRFPERRLLWDGEAMKVTNDSDAQAFVTRKYREGWTL